MALIAPLSDHLRDAGFGSLREIFDGDPPRCVPLQAWLDAWLRLRTVQQ
ncbi:hypothetical protein [Thiocystis violascens]|nr:hypothetical protein [Thiocystis violascens]